MSINMADVKQIMYGNKEVTKIEDGLGNVLWQKAGPVPSTVTITLTNPVSFSLTSRGGKAGDNGWVTISQLTEKIAASATLQATDVFYILPEETVQAIKNHTYTTDQTISSLSLVDWYNSYSVSAYVCYIKDNDLWCVGNLDNSTANDTILGTTNDLNKFRLYYIKQYANTYWVSVNNSSSTSSAIKWRFSNANYFINHTNAYNTSNKNRVQTYTWTDQTETLTYNI